MPKASDAVKREQWRSRLDRFEAGDRSIAQFCREEGVGTHTFYYWRKQLARKSRPSRTARTNSRSSLRGAVEAAAMETKATNPDPVSTGASVIHFTWDSRLSFSIPADCLDAIRCVLEYANQTQAASRDVGPGASAFRQVIVK